MKVNKIVLEVVGNDLKVEVIGNGKTLSDMMAAAMLDDAEFRELVQMSLLKVIAVGLDDDEGDDELENEVLGKLSTDTWNQAVGEA